MEKFVEHTLTCISSLHIPPSDWTPTLHHSSWVRFHRIPVCLVPLWPRPPSCQCMLHSCVHNSTFQYRDACPWEPHQHKYCICKRMIRLDELCHQVTSTFHQARYMFPVLWSYTLWNLPGERIITFVTIHCMMDFYLPHTQRHPSMYTFPVHPWIHCWNIPTSVDDHMTCIVQSHLSTWYECPSWNLALPSPIRFPFTFVPVQLEHAIPTNIGIQICTYRRTCSW